MIKDIPMLESKADRDFGIHSVLRWQIAAVLMLSLLSPFFLLSWFSIIFGGLGVVISTWHVHRSVCLSDGDRAFLLKAAGMRFGLFLLVMAAAIFFLKLQPVGLISGMAVSYIAMYVGSLIMIVKKMKGDSLG